MNKASSDSAQHAAAGIASVMQSTIHISLVWDAMTREEEERIVHEWATIIRNHPDDVDAVEHIIMDIKQRPNLAEAWAKLEDQGLNRRYVFEGVIKAFKHTPKHN